MTPLVRTEGLTRAFGGIPVLEDAAISLFPGEVHAFLGENGAGKSTLAKLIAGVLPPTRGTIFVDERPAQFSGPRAAQAQGIALIPQEPLTFPDLSVAENLFVGRQPLRRGRIDWRAMHAQAEQLLASVGLHLDPRAPVRALSLADRQLLELASALSRDARVLLLDETTASLTPSEFEHLAALVDRLKGEGRAIGFIGHRMEEIFALCDRLTVLRDGRVVGERMAAATDAAEILRLMVGRELSLETPRTDGPPGPPVLQVRALSQPPRFENIDLTLHAGEVVGLAGLVGAGRTELARALFGLTPVVSGEIRIDGQPVILRSPADALRHGIALVPEDRQKHGALLALSLWENATLADLPRLCGRGGWTDDAKARALTDTWIERLSVRCRSKEQALFELSGGNQQKIVLAKWLQTAPRVLILDEPTRGIDVGAKAQVHRLVAELAAQGLAVLLISSDLPEVLALADRVLVLRAGRIVRELDRADATPEAVIAAAAGIAT